MVDTQGKRKITKVFLRKPRHWAYKHFQLGGGEGETQQGPLIGYLKYVQRTKENHMQRITLKYGNAISSNRY